MKISVALVASALLVPLTAWPGRVQARQAAPPARPSERASTASDQSVPVGTATDARQLVDQYCVSCHNDRLKTAGMSLQSTDLSDVAANGERLEKMVRKLRAGVMPPITARRPDRAASAALATWIETELDQSAIKHPNPGRTESLHRLNRAEYQNAIRDLLGLEGIDFATLLPGDDGSYGFDNIAGVLGMTPTHLEKYLGAAREVSRLAIGDPTLPPGGETHMLPPDLSQDEQFDDLPFGTRGGVRIERYFPLDGEYIIRFQAFTGVGNSEAEPNFIELSVDGRRVLYEKMKQKPIKHTITGADIQANTDWEVRAPIKAGLRDVAVTFIQTTSGELDDFLQPFLRPPGISSFRLTRMGGYSGPYIGQVSFTGPLNSTGPGDTPSRRRLLLCHPADVSAEGQPAGKEPQAGLQDACARLIFTTLARRAYRRPVTPADLNDLMTFYAQGRAKRDFEHGVQVGLERLLASPDFLFRIEQDPPHAAAAEPYRVSDLELASRMSFFLWSSIPDEALLQLAERGELGKPTVLAQQTRRMLTDPKSDALVRNFAGQWLRLRNVAGTDPNAQMFPDFDENLRRSMRRETELLLDSVIREDRSALTLLDADYTFVDERLARHYGIPNVYGSHFRRVAVTDPNRRGLLGHASILTVTSQANRTSPVTRGKWILENLLGAPPPSPPDNIPALEATRLEGTLRQRMEQHRKNPVCSSCHNVMDPLGFSLENFDPLGQWRTLDSGFPVDASGAMPDGSRFDGVAGLRASLLARPNVFVGTLTEKLMIYALGRGLEYYDMPAVRAVTWAAARDNYRLSKLIEGIVTSVPFRMRTAAAHADVKTLAAQ
jgi:mono/diheme cytochrome c family protein